MEFPGRDRAKGNVDRGVFALEVCGPPGIAGLHPRTQILAVVRHRRMCGVSRDIRRLSDVLEVVAPALRAKNFLKSKYSLCLQKETLLKLLHKQID